MSLRDGAVEAMARAFNGVIRNVGTREYEQAPWRDDLPDMTSALDALLLYLGEHTEEWARLSATWGYDHASLLAALGSGEEQ